MYRPEFRAAVSAMDAAQQRHNQRHPERTAELTSKVLYPRGRYEGEAPLTDEALRQTRNAQPATVACAVGCFDVFQAAGFQPDFTARGVLGVCDWVLHLWGRRAS